MTQDTHKAPTRATQGAQPPRINAKVRKAIEFIATQGRTQRDAAQLAGMNEKSLSRALKRPPIAAYLEQQKILALQDVKMLRKMGEVAAINVALDLLHNSKADAIRARMVEFFAGDKAKGVTVNVQNNVNSTGYEAVRPGQRVVDIIDSKASLAPDQRDIGPEQPVTDTQSVNTSDKDPAK